MVTDEIEKIERYASEGGKLWSVNPELVISRDFYELWESSQRPSAFALESTTLVLMGESYELRDDADQIGYLTWHAQEECAALMVEGATGVQAFLLLWRDGHLTVEESPPELYQDGELTFGERLEIVYDVVNELQSVNPSCSISALTRTDFVNTLSRIEDRYDPRAVRIMKRCKLSSIRRFLVKVMEDMAIDELSNQLELPLDGSYAVGRRAEAPPLPDLPAHRPSLRLPVRTKWSIQRELDFICAANQATAAQLEVFVLDFSQAEVLKISGEREMIVRVPCDPNVSLLEGDRLAVHRRGENGAIARFYIDVNEKVAVVGRVVWRELPMGDLIRGRCFARPRVGPEKFLAGVLTAISASFTSDGHLGSPAVDTALGVEVAICEDVTRPREPATMDASQRHAWANAVSDRNPAVLIQGPPGTGKTYVLEQVLRALCMQGKRLLVTAPSNTAVDNVCRRVLDLPLLRAGHDQYSISADVAASCWMQDINAVRRFAELRDAGGGSIYAGTHVGVLRNEVVQADFERNGPYDAIIFDEAGMARMDEFLLCLRLAKRCILFGDHQQLPPFPLSEPVVEVLRGSGPTPRHLWAVLDKSALEWLIDARGFPVYLLQSSYRCQNPRLMRFSSTLFYNARVRASEQAEYYRLDYAARQEKYPASTLRFYRTSKLPDELRRERLVMEGERPGIENETEARLCLQVLLDAAVRFPLHEITIIAPYRRQVRRLRHALAWPHCLQLFPELDLDEEEWGNFLRSRISTVDSFQGGESDFVMICYVRSSLDGGVGFVDDPNRINVAHTRARREMCIIGDLDHLKVGSDSNLFLRLERAIKRDGEIVDVSESLLASCPELPQREDGDNERSAAKATPQPLTKST